MKEAADRALRTISSDHDIIERGGVFALVGLYGILANLWQVVAVSITIKSVAVLLLMPLLLAVSPTTTGEE